MTKFGPKVIGSLLKNPGHHPHVRTFSDLGSEAVRYRLSDRAAINTSEALLQGGRHDG